MQRLAAGNSLQSAAPCEFGYAQILRCPLARPPPLPMQCLDRAAAWRPANSWTAASNQQLNARRIADLRRRWQDAAKSIQLSARWYGASSVPMGRALPIAPWIWAGTQAIDNLMTSWVIHCCLAQPTTPILLCRSLSLSPAEAVAKARPCSHLPHPCPALPIQGAQHGQLTPLNVNLQQVNSPTRGVPKYKQAPCYFTHEDRRAISRTSALNKFLTH
jgi:hypothetical protein